MSLRIELVDPMFQIMREIADPKMTRDDIALTYAFGIRQDEMDWPKVNAAILSRWSMAGLVYIKTEAWSAARRG